MNLRDNIDTRFDVIDVQFCLGIALSNLGYNDLATAMITYETQESYGIHNAALLYEDIADKLRMSRDRIEDAITALADTAGAECSYDYAAVKWYCSQPIMSVRSSNTLHNQSDMVSVLSVVGASKLETIYNKVMQLLVTYPHNKLIVPYISTSLFREPFKRAITSVLRSGSSTEQLQHANLSQDSLDYLRDDFKHIYASGIAPGSVTYEPITGTPNAALCGAPIKLWYVNNKKAKFKSVIYGAGQDVATEDGSVSRLNLRDTDEELNINDIDFVDVCTKIYKASFTLFDHTGKLVYDILSHHCDRINSDSSKEFNKTAKLIYSGIAFGYSNDSIGECVNQTHRSKILDRTHYSDYLDDRFAHSVTFKDLKDIKRNVYRINETQVKDIDGHRLFSSDGHQVYIEGSESDRLKSLMDGYKAMYELIDYINRNQGRTGITINDFPVDIFRDSSYLNRFRTFDEYIVGHKIVKELIQNIEMSQSFKRTAEISDGFYKNEDINSMLTHKTPLTYIKEFSVISGRNVAQIYDVLHRSAIASPIDSAAVHIANDLHYDDFSIWSPMYDSIEGYCSEEQGFSTIDYASCIYVLNQFASGLIPVVQEGAGKYLSKQTIALIVEFLYVLERIQEFEGVSLKDSDGYFCFDLGKMYSRIQEKIAEVKDDLYRMASNTPDGFSPEQIYPEYNDAVLLEQNLEMSYSMRIFGLFACSNVFFDTTFDAQTANTFTKEDVHDIYYAYSMIRKYLNSIYSVMFKLYNTANSDPEVVTKPKLKISMLRQGMFNIAIDMADNIGFAGIHQNVQSTIDLDCLCTKDLVVYMDSGFRDSNDPEETKKTSERNERRRKKMLFAFNKVLAIFSKEVSFMNSIGSDFKNILSSATRDSNAGSTDLMHTLDMLNTDILSDSFIDSDNYKRGADFIACRVTNFNKYNFAMKDGNLIYRDSGSSKMYYHKSGVACMIYDNSSVSQHFALSDVDYDFLKTI